MIYSKYRLFDRLCRQDAGASRPNIEALPCHFEGTHRLPCSKFFIDRYSQPADAISERSELRWALIFCKEKTAKVATFHEKILLAEGGKRGRPLGLPCRGEHERGAPDFCSGRNLTVFRVSSRTLLEDLHRGKMLPFFGFVLACRLGLDALAFFLSLQVFLRHVFIVSSFHLFIFSSLHLFVVVVFDSCQREFALVCLGGFR